MSDSNYKTLKIIGITQTLPPPYAYQTHIELARKENALDVSFSLEYINREDITDEEIAIEGFTENDDFEWNGQMDVEWWKVTEAVLAKTTVRGKAKMHINDDPLYIEISAGADHDMGLLSGIPSEYGMWEYYLQELIQAVYEESGKELPLQIYILQKEGKLTNEIVLFASFAKRKASIIKNGSKSKEIALDWDKLKSYLKIIYQPDYVEGKVQSKPPKNDGVYISMDKVNWYAVGIAIVEPSKKSQTIKKLLELIDSLSTL